MTTPFIRGEAISLGVLDRDVFVGNLARWANDPDTTHFMFTGIRPTPPDDFAADYNRMKADGDILFDLLEGAGGRSVGIAGLHAIRWVPRSAEFRIIIGAPDCRGRGLGQQAARLVVGYGFERLNLNRIWLGVNAENKAAVACYLKAGFSDEGTLRQEFYRNGRYYDVRRMSILRDEFEPGAKGPSA